MDNFKDKYRQALKKENVKTDAKTDAKNFSLTNNTSLQTSQNQLKHKYRQAVEEIVRIDAENFSFINNTSLQILQSQLGLAHKEAGQIESEVLRPYRERKLNKKRYRQTFTQRLEQTNPLSEKDRSDLKRLQKILALQDEDVQQIEAEVKAIAAQQKQLKQELEHLKRLQKILDLNDCHVEAIKQQIIAQYRLVKATHPLNSSESAQSDFIDQ